MDEGKILIIAFDGLDYELIEEFGLENLKQREFGKIDNSTGISSIKTSELFASFITGKTHEVHGVKGLNKRIDRKKKRIIRFFVPEIVEEKVRGGKTLHMMLEDVLKPKEDRKYREEDLKCESIFEKFEGSRAMFVPSYNPSIFWSSEAWNDILRYYKFSDEALQFWDEREFHYRKRKLFGELESDILPPRNLLMCHFHRPDNHQHFYGDETIEVDKDRLRKLYREMDDLAAEIKDKAVEKGYDYVIFMSDHGLVAEEGHNENAFYSCNEELFTEEKPHITDFHDKIMELVEKS